ncbi:MAG: nucleotidyltransferase family protein [Candidatus Sulfotelmatobacter sp.]
MKAFLLAAGHGTRLRPITDNLAKCMVPIQGVPMLALWLECCRRAGIDEVLINLHANAGSVHEFLRRNAAGMPVHVVEEAELLGSAGTLRANRDWIGSDDLFWVFYADVLNRADLRAMLRLHRDRQPAATLGVYQVPDPRRCGIVTANDAGVIEEFVEKPANPAGNWAFSGLMIGTPAMLEAIPKDTPADIGFHVLPRLTGRMVAFPIHDYLIDIGTMENYKRAQATWPGFPEA